MVVDLFELHGPIPIKGHGLFSVATARYDVVAFIDKIPDDMPTDEPGRSRNDDSFYRHRKALRGTALSFGRSEFVYHAENL